MLRSIEFKKRHLVDGSKIVSLSEAEAQQLNFLQRRGAHSLLTSAIAKCIEAFLGKPVPNTFRASFYTKVSPEDAEKYWEQIVDVTIPFCKQLLPAVKRSLNSNDEATQAINNFKDFVESAKEHHTPCFRSFVMHVIIRS